jgi:tRNA(fMet)-specific endonuclease VapC
VARRLIVDTSVLVASERGKASLADVVLETDDVVVAAISIAELRTGVELSDERHEVERAEFLQTIIENIPVELYDLDVAEAHGKLLAHVHQSGSKRGAHDLIIAATAVATKRTILTADRNARFDELPGVESILIA